MVERGVDDLCEYAQSETDTTVWDLLMLFLPEHWGESMLRSQALTSQTPVESLPYPSSLPSGRAQGLAVERRLAICTISVRYSRTTVYIPIP